jgi:hypothetical protein
MKRIFIPTRTGTDWQRLLAKPKLHWKKGASAMTTAAAWEDAAGKLPDEIAALLSSAGEPQLAQLELLAALPEWKVELPGGETKSATDVLAICRNEAGLCIVAVEAKVLEDFGPLVSEKRASTSDGQTARLEFLHRLLEVPRFSDGIRYQLLHRTASAILTARAFHASSAVMLVQAFDTPADRRSDLEEFCREIQAISLAPEIYKVPQFLAPNLYIAWCDGNPKYRQVELPSAA